MVTRLTWVGGLTRPLMIRMCAPKNTFALGLHGLAELLAPQRRSAQVAQLYRQSCGQVAARLIDAVILC